MTWAQEHFMVQSFDEEYLQYRHKAKVPPRFIFLAVLVELRRLAMTKSGCGSPWESPALNRNRSGRACRDQGSGFNRRSNQNERAHLKVVPSWVKAAFIS